MSAHTLLSMASEMAWVESANGFTEPAALHRSSGTVGTVATTKAMNPEKLRSTSSAGECPL